MIMAQLSLLTISTPSLAEINAQIKHHEKEVAQLRANAESARQSEIASVIQELRKQISDYGISAKELGLGASKLKSVRRTGPAEPIRKGIQYQGPNGETWTSGTRGRKPAWLNTAVVKGETPKDLET